MEAPTTRTKHVCKRSACVGYQFVSACDASWLDLVARGADMATRGVVRLYESAPSNNAPGSSVATPRRFSVTLFEVRA